MDMDDVTHGGYESELSLDPALGWYELRAKSL
jgi:hypothetical protein